MQSKFINLRIHEGKYNCQYDNMDKMDIVTYINLLVDRFNIDREVLIEMLKNP